MFRHSAGVWVCDRQTDGQIDILREMWHLRAEVENNHQQLAICVYFCIIVYTSLEFLTCLLFRVYKPQDLSYRDKHWHDRCFKCSSCSTSLVNESFAFKNDQLHCASCYEQMFAPRCTRCGQVFRAGKYAAVPADTARHTLNSIFYSFLVEMGLEPN